MLTLLIWLVVVGVLLYLVEQIPMDPTIKVIIRVLVLLCVVLFLVRAFGIFDLPVPRVSR